jgi:integrase
LADFRADLQARQNTAKHVRMTGNQIADLAAGFQAQRIGDLRPAAILQAINAKRQQGASLRTCNAYLRSIKSFTRWLWRERRTADDALAGMTGYNDQTDRRHVRREVWAAELTYLLQHVEQDQRAGFNLAGPDRAILYRVALGTGFRANELRTLTVASFALDGDPPAITVRAAYSKRRRDDAQPIRPDLAELLRPWLAGRPAAEAVFGALPGGTARMLRADLKAARAAWLAEAMDDVQEHARRLQSDFLRYRDSDGRVADFHAMRHTYISGIVAGGATVKTAQELARHCSPTLTIGRYAHARLHDLTGALDALPDLDPQAKGQPDAAPLRATGTTGHTPGNGPVGPPQISPQLSRETGLRGAKGCEQPESGGLNPPRPNLLPIAGLSDPVRGAADGSKERRRWESNPRWRICNPLP